MIKKLFSFSILLLLFIFTFSSKSHAVSGYLNSFNTTYGTKGTAIDSCNLCHTVKPALNNYGNAYLNSGYNFKNIENQDSDGDGFTNIAEINARTFPGDPNSKPVSNTDTTPPTVTAFSIPATSNSLTISITTFTATDNVGVAGYLLTETSTTPSATAASWSTNRPTSYTFSSPGTKTLYAWAKDAAGNVSTSRSATTTITINTSDTTPPTVTAFSIPATSNSLTISITTFTATDNVGVAGYLLTETSTTPSATAAGWSTNRPTSYTFSSPGTKTLYAWAKDAAGNVSTSRSATTTITINTSDTTSPTAPTNLTANNVTNSSISLTWSAATDNVGVTGYKIFRDYIEIANTSSTSYTDTNITPSTTYTYYVQAFDAAGNVSSNSNIVQVTTPAITSTFRIMTPNNGEKFQAGSAITISWESHPNAAYYNIAYSTNNGFTWIPIENGILGNTYNWKVPNFKKNVKCKILVTAFNSNYVQIASDKTDLPFSIELATINNPTGGEILTNGNSLNISWTSSPVLTNTAKVSVYYKLNNSFFWKLAGTLNGNPGNYNWTVPTVNQNSNVTIKIVFRNNMGTVLGVAVSNPITIAPAR